MDLNWTAYNPGTPAERVLLVGPSLGGNAAHQWPPLGLRECRLPRHRPGGGLGRRGRTHP